MESPNETERQEISNLIGSLRISVDDRERKITSLRSGSGPEEIDQNLVLGKLEKFSPSDVAELVMQNLPNVASKKGEPLKPILQITPPIKGEVAVVDQFKFGVEIPDFYRDYVKGGVKGIKYFLTAPRIQDGFVDHNEQRRQWEKGIYTLLTELDKRLGIDKLESEEYNKVSYSKHFKNLWDHNKYSKACMLKVSGCLQYLEYDFNEPDQDGNIRSQVATLIKRFDQVGLKAVKNSDGTETDPLDNISIAELDEKVDRISKIGIDTLSLLSGGSSK